MVPTVTPPIITETDACKLLSAEQASQFLGETINPPMPYNAPCSSVCTYFTNSGKGIYIAITMGDFAKKNSLNEISQYQKGCSVSYSGGTNTATPFPPEVEAMMSRPVLELFQLNVQMQTKCAIMIEPIPEFGPYAYAYLTAGLMQVGAVAIVSGDQVYSFSYADPTMDIPGMVGKAKEITAAVIAALPVGLTPQINPTPPVCEPTPTSSPTVISSATLPPPAIIPTQIPQVDYPTVAPKIDIPTPIDDIPTPVDGGPTPIGGGPTPIGGGPTLAP
jgi:hypothetical protein